MRLRTIEVKDEEIIILTTALIVLFAGLEIAHGQSVEIYENSTLGFKFQYPTEWKGILLNGSNGVSFDLRSLNPSGVAVNRLDVFVVDLLEDKSLYLYLREYLPGQTGVDYSTLKTNEIIISDFPATRATWDTQYDRNHLGKALTVFAIKDRTVYQTHYETGPEVFFKYLPQVNNIINTFEITG